MSEEKKQTEEVKKEVTEEKKGEATAPTEEKKEEKKNDSVEVEVPKEFKALIEQIEKMSVLELHELVKVLEKKFNVSAAAVAVVAPGTSDEGDEERSDSLTVELTDAGSQKIAVIKAVKAILGLGLKDAKDLIDGAPAVLKEGVKKEEAEEIKAKITEAGGTVTLK